MFLTQALDHINQIAILAIQLLDAFLVALKSGDTDFVTPWQFMFVLLEVLRNLFWVVLIQETDGAHSRRARCSNRRYGRSNVVATNFGTDWVGERWTF
jgi:hypothetical protein